MGMDGFEGEAERAAAEIDMADSQRAGREPLGQLQARASDSEEIAGAAEQQGFALDREAQRHTDAEPDIFLQPRGAGKALGGMNDLRKSVALRANPGPDLTAACCIFGLSR